MQAPCSDSEGGRAGRVGGEDGVLLTGDPAAGHVAVHDVSRELSDGPAGRKRKQRGNKEGQTKKLNCHWEEGKAGRNEGNRGGQGNVAIQRRCDGCQWDAGMRSTGENTGAGGNELTEV